MLIELRRQADAGRLAPWSERVVFKAFAALLRAPTLYRLSARIGRLLQRPLVRDGRIRAVPSFAGRWTKTRDLPPVAARTFQERWRDL
jgi:L-lactate dehydrogenase complex protein LldF